MHELSELLYSTPAMSAAFSPEAHVRGMLTFEAALARAEARAGIIPQNAADSITASCNVELFDIAAVYREAALAGTPAIPLVRMLTARVEEEARKFVHWGATSQDAIDTSFMFQIRDGIDILISGLLSICATCAKLADEYRHSLMAGRTLLQQAVPITFGLKSARWLALAVRQVYALREHLERTLAVQLGGAAGTLGVIAGAMAKIAGDVVLLSQSEVNEVSEGTAAGKGGSSAMPQKHNPVDATRAIASARLAIGEVGHELLCL